MGIYGPSYQDAGHLELLDLLSAYDRYVQEFFEAGKHEDGSTPVCIAEFYDNEFQQLQQEQEDEDAS